MHRLSLVWRSASRSSGERRTRWRYPLELSATYYRNGFQRRGNTINISGSGLRLTTPEAPLKAGELMMVNVALPRQHGSKPVVLRLHGMVVRASRTEAALRVGR